jgi:hypothetical protein
MVRVALLLVTAPYFCSHRKESSAFHYREHRLCYHLNEKAGPSEARFTSGVCYFFDNLTASPEMVAAPAG